MKRLLIYIVIVLTLLLSCSCKVKPQSNEETAIVAADLTEKQETNNTEEKKDITDNKTEIATNEQTEKIETANITLTDETEKYLNIIKSTTASNDEKEQLHANKAFEIDGKKINLTFKEKTYVTKLASYRYEYVDSEDVVYYFHENDKFIGINNPNRPDNSSSVTLTEDEALKIAKNYADKLFTGDFDKYALWKINVYDAYNVPVYHFAFSKNYGADNSLHGEICIIEVYENGTVKCCDIDGLYSFKEFDPSLVSAVTKEDVDKVIMDSLSKKYDNIDEYEITIEGYELLQYIKDKWVIALSVTIKTENSVSYADNFFIEIN